MQFRSAAASIGNKEAQLVPPGNLCIHLQSGKNLNLTAGYSVKTIWVQLAFLFVRNEMPEGTSGENFHVEEERLHRE